MAPEVEAKSLVLKTPFILDKAPRPLSWSRPECLFPEHYLYGPTRHSAHSQRRDTSSIPTQLQCLWPTIKAIRRVFRTSGGKAKCGWENLPPACCKGENDGSGVKILVWWNKRSQKPWNWVSGLGCLPSACWPWRLPNSTNCLYGFWLTTEKKGKTILLKHCLSEIWDTEKPR